MSNVIKDNIVIPAWNIIRNDYRIKRFYLLPGLLSTIFLTVLLVYQTIYTYVEIFNKKEEALVVILNFFHSDYLLEIAIAGVIFLIIYFLLTPIFEGGLIKYIHQKNSKVEMSIGDVIGEGLYNFWPIFEYNNVFSEFKIISILNGYLFTIRFLGVEYIKGISYTFLILLFLGIILNILFAYSKYSIIIENKTVFESIGESSKITILNLKNTIKIYFFILFLNLRVIINFVIFLSFPIIMVLALGLITSKLFLFVAIIILATLFIGLIIVLSYLTAVLEVFKTSLWYYGYIQGKIKLEDK